MELHWTLLFSTLACGMLIGVILFDGKVCRFLFINCFNKVGPIRTRRIQTETTQTSGVSAKNSESWWQIFLVDHPGRVGRTQVTGDERTGTRLPVFYVKVFILYSTILKKRILISYYLTPSGSM